jgi:hypothetical protein
MPNVIRQALSATAISVTGSNGATVTLTRNDIIAHYGTESGNATARRLATIQWAKDQIANGIGTDMLTATDIDFDIDGSQVPLRLATGQWQS